MKRIFLLLALTTLFFALVQGSVQGNQKIAELRYLASQTTDGIIYLNRTGYNYYILESPRPYDVVVFFTAPECKLCDIIYSELETVSRTYRQANTHLPSKVDGKMQRAVFFAKIMYNQETREAFTSMNFNSVPNLIVFQPKVAQLEDIQRPTFLRDFTWQISPTDGQVTAQKVLDFVNKRTNRNVEYREPIWNMFIFLGFILGVGYCLFVVFMKFRWFFLNEVFWFVGSLVIYAICMAGVVYNILHDVPFTNIDRNGNFEWFHSGSRSQFGAEGFVMSVMFASIGLLLIVVQKLVRLSSDQGKIRIASLILIVIIYYLVGFVEEIYRKKSWYGPSFWPPEHYIKGPLMRDQGNNI